MEVLTVNQRKVLNLVRVKGRVSTQEVADLLKVSRQYAYVLLRSLVVQGKIIRIGKTIHAFYADPTYLKRHPELIPRVIKRRFKNKKLEEHIVEEEIRERFIPLSSLKENINSIFTFAFSEMVNNAIDHSKSKDIDVEISVKGSNLIFDITDYGIGVFHNIMVKKKLRSQEDAARELLKGKVTTQPKNHSGLGIFFTSKSSDLFILESRGTRLVVNTIKKDIKITHSALRKAGTFVRFIISTNSKRHLSHIFGEYEYKEGDENHEFNKTEVKVGLYSKGILVSRSQAKKILSGLEKFEAVALDYSNVPMIGQAFADEIYRVFKNKHPNIVIYSVNTTEGVKNMIDRVRKTTGAKKNKK